MKMSKIFYLIVAVSLVVGVILMFAVDLTIGALVLGCDLLGLFIVYQLVFRTMIKNERLAEIGQTAKAKILSARGTGMTINDVYKQMDLTLEVQPEQGEPYEVKTRGQVHEDRLASFRPGATITVMVDPSNPMEVAIADGEEGSRPKTDITTDTTPVE